eukprot:scaffold29122_cov65-Phaeocystis_antarctica.AAC.1
MPAGDGPPKRAPPKGIRLYTGKNNGIGYSRARRCIHESSRVSPRLVHGARDGGARAHAPVVILIGSNTPKKSHCS